MRTPLQEFQDDHYERPNQPWICGLVDEGLRCPSGPNRGGRCPVAAVCRPIRDGDRWICNRSPARGGTCEEGPSADGECCLVYQCQPLRSVRARRGRFARGCFLVAAGAVCLILSGSWRNEVIAPGPLTTPHAQLLHRANSTKRCASCHPASEQSFGQWLQFTANDGSDAPDQTALCLECHKNEIAPSTARLAHNVDPELLLTSTDSPASRRRDPRQELACSTCHQEHRGAEQDLTWMSNQACQACHKRQYHSFATDHPEFDQWPTWRRTRIAFDHGSHQLKHFPKENQDFSCATCHEQDTSGAFQQTLGYQETCAKCHDQTIQASWDRGVALFALPMIDQEVFRESEMEVGQWPESALGEFDGELPPLTKFLLLANDRASAAMKVLGSDFDFFDVEPEDADQLRAAAVIVIETKRLLHEVMMQGQLAMRDRVEKVLGRELTKPEFAALTARLSPENLNVMTRQWLTRLPEEIAGTKKPNPQRPAAMVVEPDRKVARQRVAAGGWMCDETTLSICYHPTGHADPWVTAWINLFVEAAAGPQSQQITPLLKQLMAPTAGGQCGSCHSLDRTPDQRFEVQWRAKRVEDDEPTFTRFSHQPHLAQAQLADCQYCHQINPLAEVMKSYASDFPMAFQSGFQLLTKRDCAECHTSHAAGDRCTQCHKYHAGIE